MSIMVFLYLASRTGAGPWQLEWGRLNCTSASPWNWHDSFLKGNISVQVLGSLNHVCHWFSSPWCDFPRCINTTWVWMLSVAHVHTPGADGKYPCKHLPIQEIILLNVKDVGRKEKWIHSLRIKKHKCSSYISHQPPTLHFALQGLTQNFWLIYCRRIVKLLSHFFSLGPIRIYIFLVLIKKKFIDLAYTGSVILWRSYVVIWNGSNDFWYEI